MHKQNEKNNEQLQQSVNVQNENVKGQNKKQRNEEEEAIQAFIGHVERGDDNPQEC